MANYDVGDRVKVVTTFRNEAGVPTSPSTFTAEYRKPGSTVATAVVPVDGGSGVFTTTLPVFDVAGTWFWYIAGTAGVIAADDGYIYVDEKSTA
jgi:hypothetical protein